MKTIKSFIIGSLVAFVGLSAGAATSSFSGTLNLSKGDVFSYYENHGSSYTLSLKSNSNSTVAEGTVANSSVKSGKFYTVTAKNAGDTTIVFNFVKGQSTYTATFTVHVSGERVIEPGKTATVEGWGNSNEKGSATWSSSNIIPSGLLTKVNIDSQSTSAMKATLTAGSTANSGTVTIGNVSNNSGSEFVYAVRVSEPGTPIAVPTAVTGLVYDNTEKTGVLGKTGYTLTGNVATDAGDYTATATLASGYCWEGGSTEPAKIPWSIGYRKATVTVVDTNKVSGADEPIYQTRNEGFLADDPTELEWTAWRTNTSEAVGTYDIVVLGEEHQGGYEITYVGGKLTITGESPVDPPEQPDDPPEEPDDPPEEPDDPPEPETDQDETIVLAPGANADLTTVTTATSWNAKVSSTSVVTVQVSRNADGTAKISLRGGTISDETQTLTAAEVLSQNRATVEIRSGSATSGQGTLVKTITVNLGEAIRLKSGESVQRAKSYTSGRRWAVACEQGGSFVDVALDKASETYSQYGYCLRTSADAKDATLTITGRDVGTETVVFGRQYEDSRKQAPKVMAIYYVTVYDDKSTPIAVPTAAQGLVYGWTNQVGVAEGEGYVLSGVSVTNAPGTFTAFATPDDGYCWTDKSRATKEITWSIAYREATVTVIDTNKVTGAAEPVYRTRNEGFIADDPTKLVWTAWRTNTSEEVGTYDIVVLGETPQGGYAITYVGGTLEITAEPVGPSIPEDEGEIEYDPTTKEVVVTPKDETVTEVEIINMPADGTVKVPVSVGTIRGVEAGQVVEVFYTAPAGAGGTTYDITAAFMISGDKANGVTVALDPDAAVEVPVGDDKTETIMVTPTLTDVGDETVEPLEVLAEEVDVGVKTIPGLTYELKRSDEPSKVRAGKVVNAKQAEGLRTKLTDPMDGGKPEKAFYIIEVKK